MEYFGHVFFITDGTTSPPLPHPSRCPDSCSCNFENKSEIRLKNCNFSNNTTTVNEIFGVGGVNNENIEALILENYTGLKNLTRSSLLLSGIKILTIKN